jgi:hypothetical protein
MAPKKKEAETGYSPVKWEFNPIPIGFVPPKSRGVVDDDGLPMHIYDFLGGKRVLFKELLDKFGQYGWEPHMVLHFPGGAGDYLIFKRPVE